MQVMRQLMDAGFVVVGPAVSAAQALELVKRKGCDAAVLDIRLGSETSEPVAQELLARGVPFLGMTGYTREQQPPIFQNAPMLPKPLRMDELIQLLRHYIQAKQ
jgi:DNA-binding NtrC family response regulator